MQKTVQTMQTMENKLMMKITFNAAGMITNIKQDDCQNQALAGIVSKDVNSGQFVIWYKADTAVGQVIKTCLAVAQAIAAGTVEAIEVQNS